MKYAHPLQYLRSRLIEREMQRNSSENKPAKPNSTHAPLSQSKAHLIPQALSLATYKQTFMARERPGSLASKNAQVFATQLKQFKPFDTTVPTAPGVCQCVPVTLRPFSWTATRQGIVITIITSAYISLRLPPASSKFGCRIGKAAD